jgi:hypothetical protein
MGGEADTLLCNVLLDRPSPYAFSSVFSYYDHLAFLFRYTDMFDSMI